CTTRAAAAEAADEPERFDWVGAALLGPAVAAILVGITFGNTWGWTSPQLIVTIMAGVACISAFWIAEQRSASPLIDPALVRVRGFSLGLVAGLLSYAVLFGSLFVIAFYLARILVQPAAEPWLLVTPIPVP